jgi:short-subunit dehydrogenase
LTNFQDFHEGTMSELTFTSHRGTTRPLAVVTGASSGIGLELAVVCAENGFDLMLAADTSLLEVVQRVRALGVSADNLEVDLSTIEGVDALYDTIGGRPIAALLANAGHGLGHAFLDQDFSDALHVLDTNVTGTIYLLHKVGREMRARGEGRILITGSIAGFQPGTFQAVYNGSKAFIDSFALAFRNELKDTGVTVTCLMPGVTDTAFFERAGLLDTKLGAKDNKADPRKVAEAGFKAMMEGEADVIAGIKNKLQAAVAAVTPAPILAEQHRRMAEPGSASKSKQ